jgi:hypothetical protein
LNQFFAARRTLTIRAVARWSSAAAVLLLLAASAMQTAPQPVRSAQLLRQAETAYAEIRRISDLAGTDRALDELAGRILDAAIASLRRLTATWRLTVSALDAGTPLAARAVDVRDRAAALEDVVKKRLASVLGLQDRLLAVKLSAADMLASVRAADMARTQELFEAESRPLWDAFRPGQPLVAPQRARAFAVHGRNCVRYHRVHARALPRTSGVARRLDRRRPHRRPRPRDPGARRTRLDAVEVLSKHPIASAILMALLVTPLLHPTAPAPFTLLLFLLGMVPFFRIASALVPQWGRPLKGLAVLFFAERFATGAPDLAPLGRLSSSASTCWRSLPAVWGSGREASCASTSACAFAP